MNEILLQYGLAGVIIIALGTVVTKLWLQLNKKDKEFQRREQEWKEVIHKLAENNKEAAEKVAQTNERSLEKIADTNKAAIKEVTDEHTDVLRDMRESVDRRQADTNQVIRDVSAALNKHSTVLELFKDLIERQTFKR